jgi:nicotinamidase-related amidase
VGRVHRDDAGRHSENTESDADRSDGIATSKGVESTARSAYDLGYNVVIVVDAVTDRDPDEHRHCVEKIFPKLAETTTTDQLLDLL